MAAPSRSTKSGCGVPSRRPPVTPVRAGVCSAAHGGGALAIDVDPVSRPVRRQMQRIVRSSARGFT
jgi:hypothetical protein